MRRIKTKLTMSLTLLGSIPLLGFGLVVIIMTTGSIYSGLRDEVHHSLEVLSETTVQEYNHMYPGDYREENGIVKKGDTDISDWILMLDERKKFTGTDYTLFYGDTRYLTTIRNTDGNRVNGTEAPQVVIEKVFGEKENFFSDKIGINGDLYFGFYTPLTNADGTVVGMFFSGRPRTDVMDSIGQNILMVCGLEIATMMIVIAVTGHFSKRLIYALRKTETFLGKVAQGDLAAEIDPYVLKRTDEIGEMGRFAVILQKAIIELVGKDTLTGLGNRRSCDNTLANLAANAKRGKCIFTVVMSDIDYFKRVNDKYGHQAGDETLKMIAELLKNHVEHLGFVFRWGGEEFLIIYEDMGEKEARTHLERLQEEIRAMSVPWKENEIRVTMTFGMAECHGKEAPQALICKADENLYKGKQQGRDRIVGTREKE